jgi:hypothetical protein
MSQKSGLQGKRRVILGVAKALRRARQFALQFAEQEIA